MLNLSLEKTMSKTELTPKDLAKAIQFLKNNAIPSEEIDLGRLVGWLNEHRDKPRYKGIVVAEINPKDLRVDIYSNSSIPSAKYKCGVDNIRITHLPTGTVVTCDSECLKHKDDLIIDCMGCAMEKLKELIGAS